MASCPRICLLSTDRNPDDSPDLRLAGVLAAAGWDVHILACEPGYRPSARGMTVSHLEDFPERPETKVDGWVGEFDSRSLRALGAMEQLHGAKPFDIIQYAEEGAAGFRVAQARHTGGPLTSAYLLARLTGPTAWRRMHEARLMAGANEPVHDFAEQHSFEEADGHVSRSAYLVSEAKRLGWAVPVEVPVVPDYPSVPVPAPAHRAIAEVVYVGPLDKLHGLRVFVRALAHLPASTPVAFVGPTPELDGVPVAQWVLDRVKNRHVNVVAAANWAQILDYLRTGNKLAVVPYLSATDVEFIRDLARNRIPFLASDYGPAAELVADDEARQRLLFAPGATDLGRALNAYLATPLDRQRSWVDRLAAVHAQGVVEQATRSFYERVLSEVRAKRAAHVAPAPRALPRVTVGVTHYNLGAFLPATLASIAAQSYPNLEVVVADDGSNDASSIAVVEEMERKYPQFKFLRGPNVGVCGNRNRCLSAATGELFFPLDADNVAAPEMVERLVSAFLRQPKDVGAVSCFWLGFTTDENLAAGKFCGAYRPTGGPRVTVGLWNPYGETSGLFRTEFLRELGGYDDLHPEYMSEDWHLYIKIAARGLKVAVIPKALYFYRIRGDSRYRTGDHGVNHLRVLPDVAAMTFSTAESLEVWSLLAGMFHQAQQVDAERRVRQEQADALQADAGTLTGQRDALATEVAALAEHRDALLAQLRSRRYRAADLVAALLSPVRVMRKLARVLKGVRRRVWGRLTRGRAASR